MRTVDRILKTELNSRVRDFYTKLYVNNLFCALLMDFVMYLIK